MTCSRSKKFVVFVGGIKFNPEKRGSCGRCGDVTRGGMQYAAVGKMLKPVKEDLATIKQQLNTISTSIDELRDRIEEIEKVLIPEEVEAKKV